MEIVMVKESELRTYEYHLDGKSVVKVFNHQQGQRVEMPFRKGRERKVYADKNGQYIKLDSYKHYLN